MKRNSQTLPDLPVKYVLYSHYAPPGEKTDINEFKNGTPAANMMAVKFFAQHLRELRRLLSATAYEGLLVLFYSPADSLPRFLDEIGKLSPYMTERQFIRKIKQECPPVRFAESVKEAVKAELKNYKELAQRVRFVTPLDLYEIFKRWNRAENLRRWFVGRKEGIRYDTPKIIEAIVRVRLLGTGIPVFRLDWDVLLRGEDNCNDDCLGLFQATATCLRAFQLRRDNPRVSTFLMSAQYDTEALDDPEKVNTFEAWRGAFATRVFPALSILPSEIKKVGKGKISWETYAQAAFNVTLARQYYGFDRNRIATSQPRGIAAVGAHPLVSVISGAYLCLSDGAIIDLQPYSNFRHNVSWIDDHLKYCLHRELRHLTTVDIHEEPLLNDAKLDTVMVKKRRAQVENLPEYALRVYLPTLLWGSVVDAWINPNPLLKFRPEMLSKMQRVTWNSLQRSSPSQGVLPKMLHKALNSGSLTNEEQDALAVDLEVCALERIEVVRQLWEKLRIQSSRPVETFASIWARGCVEKFLPRDMLPADQKKFEKCLGIAPNLGIKEKITSITQLNPHLMLELRDLIDDAIGYIEWTLNWPNVIQVIRSIEPGTIPTDLTWPGRK